MIGESEMTTVFRQTVELPLTPRLCVPAVALTDGRSHHSIECFLSEQAVEKLLPTGGRLVWPKTQEGSVTASFQGVAIDVYLVNSETCESGQRLRFVSQTALSDELFTGLSRGQFTIRTIYEGPLLSN